MKENCGGEAIARIGLIAALVSVIAAVALAAEARAGELVYKGVTHKSSLVSLSSLALSPDGKSLYAGGGIACEGMDNPRCAASAAVKQFRRNTTTGKLTYRNCLTGVQGDESCAPISGASPHALGTGLGDVQALAVSSDASSVYAASPAMICADFCYGGNALADLQSDSATGALTYRDCITGDQRNGPSGSGACSQIPSASANGYASGLNGLHAIALSPDGKSLYTTNWVYPFSSSADNSLARFDRDASGALTYRGCLTGSKELGSSGSGACTEIPGASDSSNGYGSAFYGLRTIIVSADGKSVYGLAYGHIVRLDRNTKTGAITYRGCVAFPGGGGSGSGGCSIATDTAKRAPSGLEAQSMVLSGDDKSLYVGNGKSIIRFRRNTNTGALSFAGTAKSGDGPMSALAIGANGRVLYGGGSNTVASFRLNRTGAPLYQGCITGIKRSAFCTSIPTATPQGRDSGLDQISSLAAKGKSLYVASAGERDIYIGGDIARFALAPQTKIRSGPKKNSRRHRAVLKFGADTPSRFACKLKGKHVKRSLRHWRRCGSGQPRRHGRQVYRHLRPGRKVFKVRATDRGGTTDPTPAKKRWRVG